ncbi:MAG: sterol desaturase family protein [Deltaproteobacteria bacterium]|nr:sterol desaturase family protein [Deltaproteobacteria bacterium]
MSNLVLYSIPAFIALILLELAWARRTRRGIKGYETKDTFASLAMGIINVVVAGAAKFLSIPFFALLYEYRFVDVVEATGPWAWLILLVLEDHFYYWFHRAHHEVRLLWACHVNHHSSTHYNLSTALRQAVLTPLTGPIFWAPLPLIGFPPWMVLTAQAWSLLYQFWLHTEAIDRLGPLEELLNTPSHHRVHHGKNVRYLDKNHAGIFIIWDKLFGTFAREEERVVYGLTTDIQTYNPLRIGFHEFAAIGRDVARAPSLGAKLGYMFMPPGWSHDGSTKTATELQRDLRFGRG